MVDPELRRSAGEAWPAERQAPQPYYRYILCDLLTDRVLAHLPLSGVSFSHHLSRTGDLQAGLEATTPEQVGLAKLMHAYAGRSALYVIRNSSVWWGGIPWTVQAQQGERGAVSVRLQAATFDSYAHHRRLRATVRYDQVDQARIIADLWDRLQSDPRGNIGVRTDVPLTGVKRDREYLGADLNEYGKLIEQLGDVEGGPEHTIAVYLDGAGNRVKQLRVANRIGSAEPTAVFTRARRAGGRVLQWTDTADMVESGTTFQTRGDAPQGNVAEEKEPLLSPVLEATSLLDAGWPLLDMVEDHTGVQRMGTLREYAEGMRTMYAGPMRARDYVVQVGSSGWSPAKLGDAVRMKLSDLWHTPAVDLVVRPVAVKVTAASRDGDEQVQLTLEGDE